MGRHSLELGTGT